MSLKDQGVGPTTEIFKRKSLVLARSFEAQICNRLNVKEVIFMFISSPESKDLENSSSAICFKFKRKNVFIAVIAKLNFE